MLASKLEHDVGFPWLTSKFRGILERIVQSCARFESVYLQWTVDATPQLLVVSAIALQNAV